VSAAVKAAAAAEQKGVASVLSAAPAAKMRITVRNWID
jgi:hypothetical protein